MEALNLATLISKNLASKVISSNIVQEEDVLTIQFILESAETCLGQTIIVVGDHALLGGWDNKKGIAMRTSDKDYPKWTSDKVTFKKS